MKDKIDINVCYRRVFEMIGKSCGVKELIQNFSQYTGVSLVVMNIAGDVLASSKGIETSRMYFLDDMAAQSSLLELIFECIEGNESGDEIRTKILQEEDTYQIVNIITIRGNDQCICILSFDNEDNVSLDVGILTQLNELICKALSLIMESSEEREKASRCRVPALRKIASKLLFEKGCDQFCKFRQIRDLYGENLKPGFIQVVIEPENIYLHNLQKIGDMLSDFHENLFYHMDGNQLFLLFCGVKNKERIYRMLIEFCSKYQLFCGVSDLFEDTEVFCKQRFLIIKAMSIGKRQNPERRFYEVYDYYMQIVSWCAVDAIGHARYLEKELQQLKKEDGMRGTEFYETLKEYLLMGSNVSETAKRLFIHRNTMIYRLRRITEFLEIDINNPAISQRLLLSMMLQEQELLQ